MLLWILMCMAGKWGSLSSASPRSLSRCHSALQGVSPLHMAAASGSLESVGVLLDAGADAMHANQV